MRKITKLSIPIALAAFVATAQSQEARVQPDPAQPAAGTPPKTETQRSDQQKQLTEKQKNQQSIFSPSEISDKQLKKQVTAVNKASSFIGMSIKNLDNQDLGQVNDLVFDPASGKISYAVISIGGFLGVGDKLVAIPVTSLKAAPGQDHLVLNMNRNELQSAPGLAQNNWPDLDATELGGPGSGELGSGTTVIKSTSSGFETKESETPQTDEKLIKIKPNSAEQPKESDQP